MVSYLLDTCVLSETSKTRPDIGIKLWLAETDRLAIPMGAIIEFEFGIKKRRKTHPDRAEQLRVWLENLLETGIPLVNTDVAIARKYGEMRECRALASLYLMPPSAHELKGGQDLHIAAAAIVTGRVIVTSNVRDFILIHDWFELPGLYDPKLNHWYIRPGDKHVYCPEPVRSPAMAG